MFVTSTQRKDWMYDHKKLEDLRTKSNQNYADKIRNKSTPLSKLEESYLIRSYLGNLREFCDKFKPEMRKSVIATAFMYMKRFYLNQSCMEYHPRNIGVTCAYLACKIDEFYVPIDQFIKNVNGDKFRARDLILSNELLLMKKLNFQLTVHLPHRAAQGFIYDIRARCHTKKGQVSSMEREVHEFLDKSMYTDACFLYTPSQIALASIVYGAEKCNLDLSSYLGDIIFADDPAALEYFHQASNNIRDLIEQDQQNSPNRDTIKEIEKKLKAITSP